LAGEAASTFSVAMTDWIALMKISVEISDALFRTAEAVVQREGITLELLIEEGMHHAIRARNQKPAKPFLLVPFKGDGLTPEFSNGGWNEIRDEIYRKRN
jgi:hypothetical protein